MNPTTELLKQLKSAAQEEIMCREASDTSDAWQDLASPENILLLVEISLPVLEQQGGWISCNERMPEEKTEVLVWGGDNGEEVFPMIGNWNSPGQWYGTDSNGQSFTQIFNVTHWQPRPSPPQPTTDTYRQIENDDWIEWRGGSGKPTDAVVDVRYRDGITDVGWAYIFNWEHRMAADDIIAYRVIENDGREG